MARKRRGASTKKLSTTRSRLVSGIVGGILLGVAGIWIGWLLLHQLGGPSLPALPISGLIPTAQSNIQIAPLAAEGITLGHSDQTPALNEQEALVIAGQLEPNAAANSKSATAQYVSLSYPNKTTKLNGVPAWMVLYQRIPLQPADASVDPTPSPRSYYDLYVFLDANSGKELLVVQV